MKYHIYILSALVKAITALLILIIISLLSLSISIAAQASPLADTLAYSSASLAPAAPTGLTKISPNNNPLPAFKWSAVAGATSYEVRMDSGTWADIGNKITYIQPTALTKGSHTFDVRAKDGSGAGTAASLSFSVSAVVDLLNSKIAFTSNRDGMTGDIYEMNFTGSGLTKLTTNGTYWGLLWSPDGSKIARSAGSFSKQYIDVMNSDGSASVSVAVADRSSPISWSPDGSKIAYYAEISGQMYYHIFTANTDGSGQTQLTYDPYRDIDPSWSPDGTKIAFASIRGGVGYQIYTMNANGSNQVSLGINGTRPVWSPDGSKIAFSGGIYVFNPDGTGQLIPVSISGTPVWSPDGSKIAFSLDTDGDYEIYTVTADGLATTKLTNNTVEDYRPSWSPDGTKIAFVSKQTGAYNIYVMNPDGSGKGNISNTNSNDYTAAWSPFLNLSPWAVQWGSHNTPASLAANQPVSVSVTITNMSTMVWPSGGANPVYLSYHWYDQSGQVVVWDGLRTVLPNDIVNPQSVTLTANLKAPSSAGNYTLKWDIVQEGVTWFSFNGATTLDVPVTVTAPVYNVQWGSHNTPISLTGKQQVNVSVTVTNTGTLTWPSSGANPVYLSYHWLNSSGQVSVWDGLRTSLPGNLATGQSATLTASLKAPSSAGNYTLIWDIVQEGVTWFWFYGAPTLDVAVTVATPTYDVQWGSDNTPSSLPSNQQVSVSITITNVGSLTWPQIAVNPVYLSYHWYDQSGQVIVWDGLRTSLPYDIASGQSNTITASLKAPSTAGSYSVKWDLVHEGITWFWFNGAPIISRAVTVTPTSYSVQWGIHNTPTSLTANQVVSVPISMTNTGTVTCPQGGANPVYLSYHWLNSLGQTLVWDGLRTALPNDVATDQSVSLNANLRAPSTAGSYILVWDMVQEGVTWFSGTGALQVYVPGITVSQ